MIIKTEKLHTRNIEMKSNNVKQHLKNYKLEDRSQKKKIMFLHSKNKASRKGYKGEC